MNENVEHKVGGEKRLFLSLQSGSYIRTGDTFLGTEGRAILFWALKDGRYFFGHLRTGDTFLTP